MKKEKWIKPELSILSNDEFERLVKQVYTVIDYIELFKSCNSVISRDYVMTNAHRQMNQEDYIVFLKLCYQHINDLYGPKPVKKEIPDEPFTY